MKITQTETETKKVEQTTTIEKIKCDVCGHAYKEDEWTGNEFSVNPQVNREAESINELDDFFVAYHTKIPLHVIEDGYDGTEMTFDVPEKGFLDVLNEEIPILSKRMERGKDDRLARASKREKFAEKLGTRRFYIDGKTLHHFKYVLDVSATTNDYKHVCDDCYETIFD